MVATTASRTATTVGPSSQSAPTQSTAVVASTRGYCTLMGEWQCRQRPRSISQPSTGMLSCQAMALPQPGQRERGRMTDSSLGHRATQTLRNDPKTAPKAANTGAYQANQEIELTGGVRAGAVRGARVLWFRGEGRTA